MFDVLPFLRMQMIVHLSSADICHVNPRDFTKDDEQLGLCRASGEIDASVMW